MYRGSRILSHVIEFLDLKPKLRMKLGVKYSEKNSHRTVQNNESLVIWERDVQTKAKQKAKCFVCAEMAKNLFNLFNCAYAYLGRDCDGSPCLHQ